VNRTAGPGAPVAPWRQRLRIVISRALIGLVVRCVVRLRVEGREHVPPTPVLYCFNHLNWTDPLFVLAALPWKPDVALFGPKEEDMGVGGRNRVMTWTGLAVPYKPGKNDLIDTTLRVQAVFDAGWSLGIAGEGRIHRGERELLPLNEGAAYFALRSGVPIVPLAINGTSWIGVGRRVRVRIGAPIPVSGRPSREAVAALTERTYAALRALVADFPDPPPPGRFGRWLTELFNEWPEGRRPELGPDGRGVVESPSDAADAAATAPPAALP
jgi:1-acyl-sn-glycerol-3-phosphate acyltransferase